MTNFIKRYGQLAKRRKISGYSVCKYNYKTFYFSTHVLIMYHRNKGDNISYQLFVPPLLTTVHIFSPSKCSLPSCSLPFLIPDICVWLFSLLLLYSLFPVSSHNLTPQLPSQIPLSFCSLLCSGFLSYSSVRGYTGRQRLLGGWRLMLEWWDL